MIVEAQPTTQQQPWPFIVPSALQVCLAIVITLLAHRATHHTIWGSDA